MKKKINFRSPAIKYLLKLTGDKTWKRFEEIKVLDKLSDEQLKSLQQKKLIDLISHCYHNVPYYKEIIENSGVVSLDGNIDLAKWNSISILNKNLIRENFDDLQSRDKDSRKPYFNKSGGSTGEPILLVQDQCYNEWNIANKLYYKSLINQDVGDKELRLWSSETDLLECKYTLSTRFKFWLYNRKELNAYALQKKNMRSYADYWNNYQPDWVESYANSIFLFSKFIKEEGIKMHKPKGILSTAGTLYPETRDFIEEVFGVPVYNRYGSREVGDMACDMKDGKTMRMSPWNHLIEILDDNLNPVKKGEIGKVYVTTLNNYSMPLIRYEIQDKAIKGEGDFALEGTMGKEMDFFKTLAGETVPGGYFICLLYNKIWAKQFQVIQKAIDLIEINIVLNGEKNLEDMAYIEKGTRLIIGDECKIEWNFKEEIPELKSGKYLYTISKI